MGHQDWDGINGLKLARFKEAYLEMARQARYRPMALSDGWGNILLSAKELRDPTQLDTEATTYAEDFCAEEDTDSFNIGCSDFETNRAFVWTIEAARCLAAGVFGKAAAHMLLKMAITEIERKAARPSTSTKPRAQHGLPID